MRKVLLVLFVGLVLAMCTYGIINEVTEEPPVMTVYVE